MKERQPIDDLFRDKLSNFDLPVTEEMWNSIEKGIRKNRNRILLPWIITGSAIVIIATAVFLTQQSGTIEDLQEERMDTAGQQEAQASEKFDVTNNAEFQGLVSNNENINIKGSKKEIVDSYNTEQDNTSSIDLKRESASSVRDNGTSREHQQVGVMENDRGTISTEVTKIDETVTNDKVGNEDALDEIQESSMTTQRSYIRSEAIGTPYYAGVTSIGHKMVQPSLRKIRDRNCDDEAFSSSRMFLELSYGLQKGNMIFNSTGSAFDDYNELRKEGEVFRNGTHLQALIGFQMGKRLYFKTGISYNRIESDYYFVDQINKREIRDSIWNGSEWVVNIRETDISISGINTYTFVDIPLLLSYGWQFNKLGIALTTGPMINLSFSREGQLPNLIGQGIDLSEGQWNDREIYRKTAGLNWFTSVQLSYQTHKNVELFIEPRFLSGLNSLTLENDGQEPDVSKISYPISQRMIQYGVGIGLRYSFQQ